MDTKELHFALALILSKGQSYVIVLTYRKTREWGGGKKTEAHLILGKELTDCNVYYREMDFNRGSRPWDWFTNPKS